MRESTCLQEEIYERRNTVHTAQPLHLCCKVAIFAHNTGIRALVLVVLFNCFITACCIFIAPIACYHDTKVCFDSLFAAPSADVVFVANGQLYKVASGNEGKTYMKS